MPGYINNDLSRHLFFLQIVSSIQGTIIKTIFTICILDGKIKARLLKGDGRNGFQYG